MNKLALFFLFVSSYSISFGQSPPFHKTIIFEHGVFDKEATKQLDDVEKDALLKMNSYQYAYPFICDDDEAAEDYLGKVFESTAESSDSYTSTTLERSNNELIINYEFDRLDIRREEMIGDAIKKVLIFDIVDGQAKVSQSYEMFADDYHQISAVLTTKEDDTKILSLIDKKDDSQWHYYTGNDWERLTVYNDGGNDYFKEDYLVINGTLQYASFSVIPDHETNTKEYNGNAYYFDELENITYIESIGGGFLQEGFDPHLEFIHRSSQVSKEVIRKRTLSKFVAFDMLKRSQD